LHNLESKRVLVLVNGIRWVNESSASGVSGSADLKPETSDTYSFGVLYGPERAKGAAGTAKLNFEVTYYNYKIDGAIQASDLQATYANDYKAADVDRIRSQRRVGVEVSDSAIPEWLANLQVGWGMGNWSATWTLRYIDSVEENCGNANVVGVPGAFWNVAAKYKF